MVHEQLGLTNDELLSTTRAVRRRLDFDRPVGMEVIRERLKLAVQAPTGSNARGSQFGLVTDAKGTSSKPAHRPSIDSVMHVNAR